ncbi:MAG: Hsp20/alpha crystallin family protein [Planctomycetaceae bacterium]
MNASSTNPRFSLFDELDRGLNHLVKEVLKNDGRRSSIPALSVYELDDRYVVECDLPGVELDDINLQIHDGVLEISGERRTATPENAKVTVDERSFTEFRRRLQLSKDINPEGVDAELGNGVLSVTIPKSAGVLPRKVTVRKVSDEA